MIGAAGCIVQFTAVFSGLAASGCTHSTAHQTSATQAASSMRIELLGFPGCPNTPTMRANLRAALTPGESSALDDINQEALPPSDPRRGWPAPTVLVDGRDLFGMPIPASATAGCRIYPLGVPSTAEIRTALDAARRKP